MIFKDTSNGHADNSRLEVADKLDYGEGLDQGGELYIEVLEDCYVAAVYLRRDKIEDLIKHLRKVLRKKPRTTEARR